jgi:glutathione S-transferase
MITIHHLDLTGQEFTCADVMVMFALTALSLFGGRTVEDLPNVVSYVRRIESRPAWGRGHDGPIAQA